MNMNKVDMGNEVIITSDEIKMILDHYCIGKKPLAKLLGWGETTIIRYIEGDIPTNEYSNKLKVILDDPGYYYELLLNRKDCLTGIAFKKSKKATIAKLMTSKIYAVVYNIINRSCAEISPCYVQYLLYYIQAFSLAMNDIQIFQDECGMNMEQIPYMKVYETMKHYGLHMLDMDEDYLTPQEKELIDAVYESFTWYGPKALKALMSYEQISLKISRDNLSNKIIAKDTLKDYFKTILQEYNITNVSEIGKYPDQCIYDIRRLMNE